MYLVNTLRVEIVCAVIVIISFPLLLIFFRNISEWIRISFLSIIMIAGLVILMVMINIFKMPPPPPAPVEDLPQSWEYLQTANALADPILGRLF